MRGAWEIAHLFSRSMFVYLWRLTARCAWRVGWGGVAAGGVRARAFLSRGSAPRLSLSVITSAFGEPARLRPDFPSADSRPCIWMYF